MQRCTPAVHLSMEREAGYAIAGLAQRSNDSYRHSHLTSICPTQMQMFGRREEAGDPRCGAQGEQVDSGLGDSDMGPPLEKAASPGYVISFPPKFLRTGHTFTMIWNSDINEDSHSAWERLRHRQMQPPFRYLSHYKSWSVICIYGAPQLQKLERGHI